MTPSTALDPFALFGLAPCAFLDLDELEGLYLRRSRDAHPDRFAGSTEEALELQSNLNEAYRTLRDPWARFAHLVEHASPGLMEEQKRLDPLFLAEAMEAHEEALEALDNETERNKLLEDTRREIASVRDEVASLLDSGDSAQLPRAATLLHQVRYAKRRLEALEGHTREI